ncbi:MAG: pantetheine-phosphate adenylyltransferase [Acidobacteriota bacterium]|nr:MAG: pantetheine-phosphate adenylyltransferase [Acidobacteriota bacterium]
MTAAMTAIYPGSFDPVTKGHLDVMRRSSELFGTLIVAVLRNTSKAPMFDIDERREMIAQAVSAEKLPAVTVTAFDGLLTDFAAEVGAQIIVRGLRAVSDVEYELQMSLMNRRLKPGLETVFLTASEDVSFISSRLVREIARLGGDVSGLVPASVLARLKERFGPGVEGKA